MTTLPLSMLRVQAFRCVSKGFGVEDRLLFKLCLGLREDFLDRGRGLVIGLRLKVQGLGFRFTVWICRSRVLFLTPLRPQSAEGLSLDPVTAIIVRQPRETVEPTRNHATGIGC